MADRSPSKPRRSLTPPEVVNDLLSPPQASASSSHDEADDIDEESDADQANAEALRTQGDALDEGRQQEPQEHQQQLSPGASSTAEDATLDRSPSKPKRVTSPVTAQPTDPPFFRRSGSLRLSLREDPEPPSGPVGVGMNPLRPTATSSSVESSSTTAAEALLSSLPCSQGTASAFPPLRQQQPSLSLSPPPPLHYTSGSPWHGSASLSSSWHHPRQSLPPNQQHMDDESTQTWNESTQTFATFFASPSGAAAFEDSMAPSLGYRDDEGEGTDRARHRDWGRPRGRQEDDDNDDNDDADDVGNSEAIPTGDGAPVAATPTTPAATAEAAAGAPADPASAETSGKSNSSPSSNSNQSPASASVSLTGAPHPAPASTTTTERRQRRRKGEAAEAAGAAASVASSSASGSSKFRPALTIEVAPGLSRPLWHSDVTRCEVRQGRARECVCPGCRTALYYVPHAAYVLCPVCSTVGPSSGGVQDESSRESAICVGVRRDEYDDQHPSSPTRT